MKKTISRVLLYTIKAAQMSLPAFPPICAAVKASQPFMVVCKDMNTSPNKCRNKVRGFTPVDTFKGLTPNSVDMAVSVLENYFKRKENMPIN